MGKPDIIAVSLLKGGCGKTTFSVNIAHALALRGSRVALIDCDRQGNASSTLGQVDSPMMFDPALAEFFLGKVKPHEILCVAPMHENLFFVPNNIRIEGVMGILEKDEPKKLRQHAVKLKEFLPLLEKGEFDYVIIDCPPDARNIPLQNAYSLADYVISPIDGIYAFDSIAPLTEAIRVVRESGLNPGLVHLGYVQNKVKIGSVNLRMIAEKLADYVGSDMVFKTPIPETEVIKKAQSAGASVFSLSANSAKSQIARAFKILVEEMIERIAIQKQGKQDV